MPKVKKENKLSTLMEKKNNQLFPTFFITGKFLILFSIGKLKVITSSNLEFIVSIVDFASSNSSSKVAFNGIK